MPGRLAFLVLLSGGVLVTTNGCARPYYYQPPAYPPMPVQTLTPGPAYVPGTFAPGTIAPGGVAPGTVLPGGSAPLEPQPYTQPPSTFDPQPGGGGTTDPYFPGGTPQNTPVPNYSDPNYQTPNYNDPSDDFPSPIQGDLNEAKAPGNATSSLLQPVDTPQFEAVPQTTMQDPAVESALAVGNPGSAAIAQTEFATDGFATDGFATDGFAGDGMTTQPSTSSQPATTPSPYDFDADGYTWLRGLLSYDTADDVWTITFDVTPDSWDTYAGHLTLDGAVPQDIRDGEIVLVEGAVDAGRVDRFGKPVYRAATITPLEAEASR